MKLSEVGNEKIISYIIDHMEPHFMRDDHQGPEVICELNHRLEVGRKAIEVVKLSKKYWEYPSEYRCGLVLNAIEACDAATQKATGSEGKP